MQINFLTKNFTLNDELREVIQAKLSKLDKYFDNESTAIKVRLKEGNGYNKLELTIILGAVVLRSEVTTDDMNKTIDIALPKLERQIVRHFSRGDAKYKRGASVLSFAMPEAQPVVSRTKSLKLTPMTVAQALIEIEQVEHDFFVFLNNATDKVSVLYKRGEGDYGVIEAAT